VVFNNYTYVFSTAATAALHAGHALRAASSLLPHSKHSVCPQGASLPHGLVPAASKQMRHSGPFCGGGAGGAGARSSGCCS